MDGKDANLTGSSTVQRAELVPGQNPVLSNRTATKWFNTAAFCQIPSTSPTCPGSGLSIDGNSSRNMLRGPTFKDVDLAVSRDFVLKEHLHLQLRADAYNVFNLVSLNPPGATVGSATFGVITSASAMRQLQLGLRFTF